MKKKVKFFLAVSAFICLLTTWNAHSQDGPKRDSWYHYEPSVCMAPNGETFSPVCEYPMMDGPCIIYKKCNGVIWE